MAIVNPIVAPVSLGFTPLHFLDEPTKGYTAEPSRIKHDPGQADILKWPNDRDLTWDDLTSGVSSSLQKALFNVVNNVFIHEVPPYQRVPPGWGIGSSISLV